MTLSNVVRVFPLAAALAILACASDPCVTCSSTRSVPPIGGAWTVSYSHSDNGSVAGALVEKFLIIDLVQEDSMLGGRAGGTVVSCTAQPSVVCTTVVLYTTAVVGRVRQDSSVTLTWLEDTTQVELKGKVGVASVAGTTLGTSWTARPLTAVPVAQARVRTGDTVIVRGVITVDEGAFSPGNVVYVQDGTAGIEVIGLGAGPLMSRGDSVLIRGISKTDAAGEPAIVPIAEVPFERPPEAVKEGSGTVPTPRVVTVADLLARQYEGSLVTLPGVHRVATFTDGTAHYGMWFQDASGAQFHVWVHDAVAASVTLDSWNGGVAYDLTGIQGFGILFFDDPPAHPVLQLRGPDDRVLR